MSEHDKKDFEFIKEQVIEKKRKKIKKKLMPLLLTVSLAILFGLIAAVTFVLAEPRLKDLLHKEVEAKTPAAFPTKYPQDIAKEEAEKALAEAAKANETLNNNKPTDTPKDTEKEPKTVIVEQQIDADLEDYSKMYEDLGKVITKVNKSLVTVIGITEKEDVLFGTTVEMKKETTGLIVHNNSVELLILTSLDRIDDAHKIKVRLSEITTVDAVIQAQDKELNLAVIAIPLANIPISYMSDLTIAELGESYTLSTGSPVIAMGNPNGHVGSVDIGIISSHSSSIYLVDNKLDLFNTDIFTNENSDGVIVNLKGEVIGIITRTLKKDVNKELSTAIGISKLKAILTNMLNKEPRVYFGVITMDMTDDAKREHKIINGVYVNDVVEDSPAYNAGIQTGDIILQIDDNGINNTYDFFNTISTYDPEKEVKVKIKRMSGTGEKEMNCKVTLAEKK